MILILTDEEEPTTDFIIDWLLFLNKEFIRISSQNTLYIEKIYETRDGFEACFFVNHHGTTRMVDTKDISSYWYRRSQIDIFMPVIPRK